MTPRPAGPRPAPRRPDARAVALRALVRVDVDGAYANLALRHELDRSDLEARDRAFVTDLVYGTTRLRRRLDHTPGRQPHRPVDHRIRPDHYALGDIGLRGDEGGGVEHWERGVRSAEV